MDNAENPDGLAMVAEMLAGVHGHIVSGLPPSGRFAQPRG
jgi:hypothetical protein